MRGEGFALAVSLSGMPPGASLEITLPRDYARLSIGQLLDSVFPEDEAGQLAVEQMLDVPENPDLPDIYDCFLPVFDHYRSGLCRLNLTGALGRPVQLSDIASDFLQPLPDSSTTLVWPGSVRFALELAVEPEYRPLEYAVSQGYADSEDELLAWLRSCTLLYYLDKHEYRLPPLTGMSESSPLRPIAQSLFDRGFLAPCGEAGLPRITGEGRGFISALLSETGSCIDRFDVFKDVLWEEDAGSPEFDTGSGLDLRVQVFVAEGLDPVRTVFLLRLYDGTFDEFVSTWPERIGDIEFFNMILEPVVDRFEVPGELIQEIVEAGYACLEERAESARKERMEAQIAQRVRTSFGDSAATEGPPG